jgi:lactate dehydrogenase-like 2-hydroxyacid dehydrogenase
MIRSIRRPRKARNIRVTNTPDVLNDAVAELTVGLMISPRPPHPAWPISFVRDGKWTPTSGNMGLFSELNGKTVGILGPRAHRQGNCDAPARP